MPIAFDQVSFSYAPPSKKKTSSAKEAKQALSFGAGAEPTDAAGGMEAKPGASKPPEQKPLWGNAPDATWAIRNIDFTLEDGEFFGIAGHTGSGKSTLIQHMNGLIHPRIGRVLVDGQDISDRKIAARVRTKVGLVFQYPEHQLFAATVYDDVAFGPRNMGLSAEEVDVRVREALGQVALDFEKVQAMNPFELSGGQQRRVAFAGVLAMKPSTLVLDEPVAGLDPASREDFLQLIASFHREGMTVVLVSHNMDNLASFCSRILVLKEGDQLMLGSPEEVFLRAEELKAIGLGVPSAQRMANSLKVAGLPLEDRLYDTQLLADSIAALYQAGA
ncbi:MAG: energy-coupling factor transporter ATPase [Eggerthellaceae bacterium]|nr:energy-coupling factor transporter ATPase [Eggerthellaceae bacterium]